MHVYVYYIFSTDVSSGWRIYSVLVSPSFPDIHDWTSVLRSRVYKVSQYVCVFVCEYAVNCCVADQPTPASLT